MDTGLWDQSEQGGKEVPQAGKNEEEIQRFTVDENISDVDRVVLYLSNGHYVQQRHGINSLPAVLKGKPKATVEMVLHLVSGLVFKLDVDAQISCAESLELVIKEKAVAVGDATEFILPIILKALDKEKSQDEVDAWVAALAQVCSIADRSLLGSQVLPIALAKGKVSETAQSRATCCRILGSLATRLAPADAEGPLLRTAVELCQDTEYAVRIAMCAQLPAVARAISRELVGEGLLDEALELLKDEEAQVRTVALSALLGIIPHLSPDVRKARVMPVLRQHMQPLELDPSMQRCVAALFPQLLATMQPDMGSDDVGRVYGCFRRLAARQDTELRRICAQQLLSVLKSAQGTTAAAQLLDTCLELGGDADEEVKRHIAGIITEVLMLVDRTCLVLRPLQRRAIALLRDSSPAVRNEVLPSLVQLLPACHTKDDGQPVGRESITLKDSPLAGDLLDALVVVDSDAAKSWRTQLAVAKAFPVMTTVFPSEVIWETFLPMALRYVSNGAGSVKAAAADGVAAFFRGFRKERHRTELYCRLLRDYARGRSCCQRMAFVHVASAALQRFSKRFFKELHLLDACLELLADNVPNVRLAAARLLPCLKLTIRLPEDVDYLERLNNVMSALMTDNDRDVSQAARTVHDAFKRTPVRMTGGAGVLDMNGSAGGGVPDLETEERRRQEEEVDFTLAAEEMERIRGEMGTTDSKRRHARIAALVNRKPSVGKAKLQQAVANNTAERERARTPVGANIKEEASSSSSGTSSPSGILGPSSSTSSSSSSSTAANAARREGNAAQASSAGRSPSIASSSAGHRIGSGSPAGSSDHSGASSSYGQARMSAVPVSSSALWSNRSRVQTSGGGDGGPLGPLLRPSMGSAASPGSSPSVLAPAMRTALGIGASSSPRPVGSSVGGTAGGVGALQRPGALTVGGLAGSGSGTPSGSSSSKLPALQMSPKSSTGGGIGSAASSGPAGTRLGASPGGLVSGSKLIGAGRGASGSSVLGSPGGTGQKRIGHGW